MHLAAIRVVFATALFGSAAAVGQTPVVSFTGETMRLQSASVGAGTGGSWNVTLQMANDNNNASLPSTWRRWWHCQVGNLAAAGTTLNVSVTNAGYSDVILPVWSLSTDGVNFPAYTRVPLSAVPTVVGSTQHRFTLVTPPGVIAIRLAKFFPYTVTRKNAMLASLAGDPRVRSIVTIGNSQQGRPIEQLELTDGSVPDTNKQRIWIHAGVHPAETTAYLVTEGLLDWLRSGDPYAEALLDHALIDVVPMPNPDGVFLGNYRANANSVEIESQWSAPYTSTQPEVVALRTAIEGYMGTVASPAAHPIRVLLNLHSSHNVSFPFHFRHTANAAWTPGCTDCGVLPLVNQLEGQWITRFAARSAFVAIGTTQSSTLGTRPFVESMMHDRWTSVAGWLGAPGFQQPVMAITFEGTYGFGPDGVTWNTEADYRQCGAEMGRALFDHLGLALTASSSQYGTPCVAATLGASLLPQPNGSHVANLAIASAASNGIAVLAVGAQPIALPLPAPWVNCTLWTTVDGTVAFLLDAAGATTIPLPVPAIPGLAARLQVFTLDAALTFDASNGLFVGNDY